MSDFTNRTYDEIAIGQSETSTRTLTATDIEALALAAGDVDGYHLDEKDPDDRPSAQAAAAVAMVAGLETLTPDVPPSLLRMCKPGPQPVTM